MLKIIGKKIFTTLHRIFLGSPVAEYLTRDLGAAGSSLTGVSLLCL